MYHPGEIKTPGLELLLVFLRLLYFVAAMLLVAGTGTVLRIPAAVTGVIAGVAAYILLSSGLFEVTTHRCPYCGNVTRTIKDFGSYRCSNCGQESYIKGM
ncbi:hypothetical protein [Desulfofundulus sp.]|uniref:hypothetical protein n=1 Tax=Desulfofundulus sp. TaxID=2282750 RepID=UPI003C707C28